MSDTPETDDQPIIYAMNDLCYQVPCVDLEFARKLERERDEARVHWGTESMNAAQFFGEKTKAIAERDEAREQIAKLRDIAERAIDECWFWSGRARTIQADWDKLNEEGAK